MATESAVLSYQVLLICTLYILTFGSHVRKLTSDELRNIGQSTKSNFIAVFFNKPGELKLIFHSAACNMKCSLEIICVKNSREVVYLVILCLFYIISVYFRNKNVLSEVFKGIC